MDDRNSTTPDNSEVQVTVRIDEGPPGEPLVPAWLPHMMAMLQEALHGPDLEVRLEAPPNVGSPLKEAYEAMINALSWALTFCPRADGLPPQQFEEQFQALATACDQALMSYRSAESLIIPGLHGDRPNPFTKALRIVDGTLNACGTFLTSPVKLTSDERIESFRRALPDWDWNESVRALHRLTVEVATAQALPPPPGPNEEVPRALPQDPQPGLAGSSPKGCLVSKTDCAPDNPDPQAGNVIHFHTVDPIDLQPLLTAAEDFLERNTAYLEFVAGPGRDSPVDTEALRSAAWAAAKRLQEVITSMGLTGTIQGDRNKVDGICAVCRGTRLLLERVETAPFAVRSWCMGIQQTGLVVPDGEVLAFDPTAVAVIERGTRLLRQDAFPLAPRPAQPAMNGRKLRGQSNDAEPEPNPIQSALDVLAGGLPGWIEFTAKRSHVDAEIARIEGNEALLKTRMAAKPEGTPPFELKLTTELQEKGRHEAPVRERLEVERQAYEAATAKLLEAERTICRFGRRHAIETTPLKRLLELKELTARHEAELVLSHVADALPELRPHTDSANTPAGDADDVGVKAAAATPTTLPGRSERQVVGPNAGIGANTVKPATTRVGMNSKTKGPGKPPPRYYFKVYFAAQHLPGTQTEVAKQLTDELFPKGLIPSPIDQGKLSKILKRVKKFLSAGGALPDEGDSPNPKHVSMDPSALEKGKRLDSRKPRPSELD
jgi:hypothetical protein